jgi:hypothetical protein
VAQILVFHQGMWHRGMPNPGDRPRLMYKIRLNPSTTQVRQWDTSDLPALDSGPGDHIFATFRLDSIAGLLRRRERWMGEADHRLDLEGTPPYATGTEALRAGWRLLQVSPVPMRIPGAEFVTGPLAHEAVLERIVLR